MLANVPGFSLITADTSEDGNTDSDISLDTVRQAIDSGCFSNFDQFEYALFRLIEQAKKKLAELKSFFD